jgi:hypothetical protein
MAVVSSYCFVFADGKEAAVRRLERWVEDYAGKEFYDGYVVKLDQTVLFDMLSTDYLDKERARVEDSIGYWRTDAGIAWKSGNRRREAYAMRHASDLLDEKLCDAMPYFNIECFDYTLPSVLDPSEVRHWFNPTKDGQWWAVMVDFHC